MSSRQDLKAAKVYPAVRITEMEYKARGDSSVSIRLSHSITRLIVHQADKNQANNNMFEKKGSFYTAISGVLPIPGATE